MQMNLLVNEPYSASADDAEPSAVRLTSILAENAELKAEIEQLRAERVRAVESQRTIMRLLDTVNPEKIAHDIRNLLNERDLLKTLVDQM
jgi:hypothetical protein